MDYLGHSDDTVPEAVCHARFAQTSVAFYLSRRIAHAGAKLGTETISNATNYRPQGWEPWEGKRLHTLSPPLERPYAYSFPLGWVQCVCKRAQKLEHMPCDACQGNNVFTGSSWLQQCILGRLAIRLFVASNRDGYRWLEKPEKLGLAGGGRVCESVLPWRGTP